MTVEQFKDKYEKIRIESKELLKELAPLLRKYRNLSKRSGDLLDKIGDSETTLYVHDGGYNEISDGWDDYITNGLAYLFDIPELNDFDDMLGTLKLVSKSKFKFTKNKENK